MFEAHVSPLGLARYVLIPMSAAGNPLFEHVSSVELFNGGGLTQKSDSRFKLTAHSADDEAQEFALDNSAYTLTFSAELGHLKVHNFTLRWFCDKYTILYTGKGVVLFLSDRK